MVNDNLEATAKAQFEKIFAPLYEKQCCQDGWNLCKLGDICMVKGGKRLPADSELLSTPTKHPYVRVRDLGKNRYICLTDEFQYIDDETYDSISRYIVGTNDIVISIVGTIGLIGKIHSSLKGANLTENCVKLTQLQKITADYLYYTLSHKKDSGEIDLLSVGAVQAKLPIYNIQSIPILIPPNDILEKFQAHINAFNESVEANTVEIQRLKGLSNILLSKLSVLSR